MPLFVVKLIDFAAKPLGISLLALLVGLAIYPWNRTTGLSFSAFGFLFLWVTSTPIVGKELIQSLEEQFPPRPVDSLSQADAIVVLGSGGRATPPRLHPDLNDGSDRLWHTARLYKSDIASTIIATGGSPPGVVDPAAPAMQKVMTSFGVPKDSILLEVESNTTYENALYTAQICRDKSIEKIILVTSAAHMRRALGAFRAAIPDVEISPAATDYRGTEEPFSVFSVFPSMAGLSLSTTTFHERVGYIYYKTRGWISTTGPGRQ